MENKQSMLSVIVPIYNVEKYLNKCIESIVRQTYMNLEIILVNDGSIDRSGEICDEWAEKDTRIRVLHKMNGGLVSARQAGIQIAMGDYVAYVDGDDWIEEGMYECLMEIANSNHPDLVTSGLIRDYENHSVVEPEKLDAGIYVGENLYQLLHCVINTNHFFDSQINLHITNKVFKRDKLVRYQMEIPIDAKVGEDADVVYPYIFESKKIAVSGKCFYHYVMRADSIMGISAAHARSREVMKEIFFECIFHNKNRIENIKEQLSQVLAFFTCMADPGFLLRIKDGMIYPFRKVRQDDKVILYGTGRFGKAVKELLASGKYCEIVAWADKVEGKGIISPDKIINYDFDSLILAVINATVADDIESMLVSMGIDKHKICRIGVQWLELEI